MHGNTKIDQNIKKVSRVLVFVSCFIILEIYGHIRSNSLSLLADAMHLIVDVLGFIISLLSLILIRRGHKLRKNFGYFKLEPLGALLSVMLVWVAMGHLFFEAIKRLKSPKKINEKSFIIIGIIGFLLNLINLYIMGHKHNNLNMKAVYIHLIGDIIQTLGILITSLVTYFYPRLLFIDSLCTLICGLIVIFSCFKISKEAIGILMDSFPEDINVFRISNNLLKIKYVLEIVDIKIWAQSKEVYAINLKLKAEILNNFQYKKLKEDIYNLIKENDKLYFMSIEIINS